MNKILIAVLLSLSCCVSYTYESLLYLKEQVKRGSVSPIEIIKPYTQDKAVVLFYKPSCPYCVYMESPFKSLATKNQDKAQFIMVDIQQKDQPYKSAYGFNTVPTVVYFKNGKIVKSHGSDNKTVTLAGMEHNLKLLQ